MKKNRNKNIDHDEDMFGLFLDEDTFDVEIELGRDYFRQDVPFFVNLYKINILESKTHKLYGQSKQKKFFPPIKLNGMVVIEKAEQKHLTDGGIVRDDSGKMRFNVYLKELEEKNVVIDRGDILEYNLSGDRARYYEVEDAQNVTDVTEKSIAGLKPYYKEIIAIPVKEDVVPLLNLS